LATYTQDVLKTLNEKTTVFLSFKQLNNLIGPKKSILESPEMGKKLNIEVKKLIKANKVGIKVD
jgi:hypothetical protein